MSAGCRVAITGIGLASPIGNSLDAITSALKASRHGIFTQPEWNSIKDMGTRLGGIVTGIDLEGYERKRIRTMGRVALLATFATEKAIEDAGLDPETVASGRTGLAYGSTHGSTAAQEGFCRAFLLENSLKGLMGSTYMKFMSHTCAANLALYFGITGRVLPICSACVSATQAIGAGYELIKYGVEEVMICGGAEEMHPAHAAVFDIMYATSTRYNDRPDESPRPFDAARDGLVVGEGAGTLVLESFERASARGARIHGELLGYGTNCDGTHVTAPAAKGMAGAIRLALSAAGISPSEVDYVNAHATGTALGDVSESKATLEVLGAEVPVSSTKGHTGHTLGACGAIEAAFCIAMMNGGFLAPTRNLEEVDPQCAPLNYLRTEPRAASPRIIMSNNFAFGGINASLVIRRV